LYPEDGEGKLLRKFRNYVAIDRASYPRGLECSSTLQSQKQVKKQPSLLAAYYIRVEWIFGEMVMIFATLQIPFLCNMADCSSTLHCFNIHRPITDLSPTHTEQRSNGVLSQIVI